MSQPEDQTFLVGANEGDTPKPEWWQSKPFMLSLVALVAILLIAQLVTVGGGNDDPVEEAEAVEVERPEPEPEPEAEPEPELDDEDLSQFEILFLAAWANQGRAENELMCRYWNEDRNTFIQEWESEGGLDVATYSRGRLTSLMETVCD